MVFIFGKAQGVQKKKGKALIELIFSAVQGMAFEITPFGHCTTGEKSRTRGGIGQDVQDISFFTGGNENGKKEQ